MTHLLPVLCYDGMESPTEKHCSWRGVNTHDRGHAFTGWQKATGVRQFGPFADEDVLKMSLC